MVSSSQKQPCLTISLHVLEHEQIFSFSTLWSSHHFGSRTSLSAPIWPSYSYCWWVFCFQSLHQLLDFDTSIPALWRLLVISVTVAFGGFLHGSHNAVNNCCCSVQSLILTTPMVSFFFKTFQEIILLFNDCALALINFPSFLSWKMACLSPTYSSLVFMLVLFNN